MMRLWQDQFEWVEEILNDLTLPQIMYTTGREYEMHNVIKAIYQKECNIDFLVVYEMYTTSLLSEQKS
ncbi:MAG: hypothetical protein V2A69_13780 [Pseudomonadota bacterium]